MAPRAKRQLAPSATGRSAPDTASDWIWRRLAALLVWSVMLTGVAWGMRELETRALAARPPVTCRLEWADLPAWLSAPSGEQILQQITWSAGLRPDDRRSS